VFTGLLDESLSAAKRVARYIARWSRKRAAGFLRDQPAL